MRLVVDVNVVFSALVNKGESSKVFEVNKQMRRLEFIAPEFLLTELQQNIDKLQKMTRLTKEEITASFLFITEQITFIPSSIFLDKLPEAMQLNFDDSPYLALALTYKCPIFSGDKGLKKQTKVEILSPREVLDMLGIT